jgi:hypothetical protein
MLMTRPGIDPYGRYSFLHKGIKFLHGQFDPGGEIMFICPSVRLHLRMFKLVFLPQCAVDLLKLVMDVIAPDQTHVR